MFAGCCGGCARRPRPRARSLTMPRRRSTSANWATRPPRCAPRSEEHTSELQSLMRISYAVFCLKKKRTYPLHENHTVIQTLYISIDTYANNREYMNHTDDHIPNRPDT